MRLIKIIVLLLFCLSSVCAASSGLVNDFAIPVTFTYRSGINAGFSISVPGTAWYESNLGMDGNEIRFKYDSMTGNIETGTFNFYVQIYTTNKVKVSVAADQICTLTGDADSVDNNKESLKYSVISESSFGTGGFAQGKVLYDESTESVDLVRPRVFSYPLNLVIDPAQLINLKSTRFEGVLSFKVEVLS